MSNDIDTEVLQVLSCQSRQDRVVDRVFAKASLVLSKAKASEPVADVDPARAKSVRSRHPLKLEG